MHSLQLRKVEVLQQTELRNRDGEVTWRLCLFGLDYEDEHMLSEGGREEYIAVEISVNYSLISLQMILSSEAIVFLLFLPFFCLFFFLDRKSVV